MYEEIALNRTIVLDVVRSSKKSSYVVYRVTISVLDESEIEFLALPVKIVHLISLQVF